VRTRLAVLSAAALLVLGSAGCNKDDNPAIDVGPTTTAGVTSTTVAATSSTVASGPSKTFEGAAKGLFERWQKKDRAGASRYGRQRAIDELFKHPDTGDVTYDFQGCEPQGGQFVCSWTYPGGALQMTVEGVAGGGYVVDLVTYIAD
jgi:hypothetical protein